MAYDPQRNVFWYADMVARWRIVKKIVKTVISVLFGILIFLLSWNFSGTSPEANPPSQDQQSADTPTAPPAN